MQSILNNNNSERKKSYNKMHKIKLRYFNLQSNVRRLPTPLGIICVCVER